MKLALLITGYARSLMQNYNSIKKNVIQGHDVDVYILCNITGRDKYNNNTISRNFIEEIDPVVLIYENDISFTDDENLNNNLNQAYKLYIVNEHQKNRNIDYDVVVRCRPDIQISEKIDYSHMQTDIIYIPSDSKLDRTKSNIGVCDGFAYGSKAAMNFYCSWFMTVKANPDIRASEHLMLKHISMNCKFAYKLIDLNYVYILSQMNAIAIAGDSGTGKSTLASALQSLFKSPFILECDRYHKWDRYSDKWKTISHLDPRANYLLKMEKDVFDLKMGKTIYQVNYDHDTGRFTQAEHLGGNMDTLIVCGLHTHYLNKICNITIYVEATERLKVRWKINRDTEKRGKTIEQVQQQIIDRQSDFYKYVDIQRGGADIIISYYDDKQYDDLIGLKIIDKKGTWDYGYVHEPMKIILQYVLEYIQ
jgi:uridine kinase